MRTLRDPVEQPPTESPTRMLPRSEPATPVFVDVTGRRQRWVRRSAAVVTLTLVGYLAVAGVLLVVRPGVSPLPLPGLSSHTQNTPADQVRHQRTPVHHVRTVPTMAAPTTQTAPSSASVQVQPAAGPSQPMSTTPPPRQTTAPEPSQQPHATSHPTHTHTPPGRAKATGTPPGWSHGHSTGKSDNQGQN